MTEHIILFSSARQQGNTYVAAQALAEQLEANIIHLDNYEIKPYRYDIDDYDDDFISLMVHLLEYQHWVFASPVYWYNTTVTHRNFFDRLTQYLNDERLQVELRRLRQKNMSVLSTSNDGAGLDAFVAPFRLTAQYLGMEFVTHYHAKASQPSIVERKAI
ncbi:flavodoxin family protein [Pseudoalteromonas sp. SSDWG2]|uniref:flavodoxin family protein n=1 Tax=Pseudoalteromonas sp. SSDWG2 TaxID=3139391 RepID=UPI003BA9D109